MSPLIDPIRNNSSWLIGRGNISIGEFCDKLDVWTLSGMAHRPLFEVVEDRDELHVLLDHLPPAELRQLNEVVLNDNVDRFTWRSSGRGEFEARILWRLKQPVFPRFSWSSKL
ncbi:hypothetical protein QQ045_000704 [Rhodiola kirilowii]